MNEKTASWETVWTLVHYHYHYHDSCRWWDSQSYPPPCALGCTSKRSPCHPQSFCSIVLPASTEDTQAEQRVDDVLQTSAQVQAKTRFSPTNPGCQWLGSIQPISQLLFSCWSCNTYPRWHRGKAERETLGYQTSKSSKCQTCFASSIKKLCFCLFVCFTSQQAVWAHRPTEIQVEKWERDLWKSHFSSRLFFLDICWVVLYYYHCKCIHERGNSKFIVNLKKISWGFSEMVMSRQLNKL